MHTILRLPRSLSRSPGLGDPATRSSRPPRPAPQGLLGLVLLWQERAAQRRALARLDARALRDIGLSRAEAEREAARPFWRA